MMKFRAWDVEEKIMYPVVGLTWTPETESDGVSGFITAATDPASLYVKIWPFESDKVVLMRSSGLIDMHGKEMFEGDIFKIINPLNPSQWTLMTVEWHDGCFYFHPVESESKDVLCPTFIVYSREEAQYYEIVGNVYKNPELLKPHKAAREVTAGGEKEN